MLITNNLLYLMYVRLMFPSTQKIAQNYVMKINTYRTSLNYLTESILWVTLASTHDFDYTPPPNTHTQSVRSDESKP